MVLTHTRKKQGETERETDIQAGKRAVTELKRVEGNPPGIRGYKKPALSSFDIA